MNKIIDNGNSFDWGKAFTYESWNGRMKVCRGVEATLSKDEVNRFSREHLEMLKSTTDDSFY